MFYAGPYIKNGQGKGAYKQITGCFRPSKVATIEPHDGGGQVDSNGGAGGRGNPANSACAGCEYSNLLSLKSISDRYTHTLSLSLEQMLVTSPLLNPTRTESVCDAVKTWQIAPQTMTQMVSGE